MRNIRDALQKETRPGGCLLSQEHLVPIVERLEALVEVRRPEEVRQVPLPTTFPLKLVERCRLRIISVELDRRVTTDSS